MHDGEWSWSLPQWELNTKCREREDFLVRRERKEIEGAGSFLRDPDTFSKSADLTNLSALYPTVSFILFHLSIPLICPFLDHLHPPFTVTLFTSVYPSLGSFTFTHGEGTTRINSRHRNLHSPSLWSHWRWEPGHMQGKWRQRGCSSGKMLPPPTQAKIGHRQK